MVYLKREHTFGAIMPELGRLLTVGVKTSFTWLAAKKCTMKGVGHTMDFQKRTSNYISHIHKKKPTCGIFKHSLLKEVHSVWDFEIMGIIQLENPPKGKEAIKAKLKESEAYWQLRLKTI